jgi:hypothetical protein
MTVRSFCSREFAQPVDVAAAVDGEAEVAEGPAETGVDHRYLRSVPRRMAWSGR